MYKITMKEMKKKNIPLHYVRVRILKYINWSAFTPYLSSQLTL